MDLNHSEEDWILRKINKKDISSLSLLARKTFEDTFRGTCSDEDLETFCHNTYNEEVLLEEYENPLSEVWVIEIEEKLIAYLKLNFSAPLPSPEIGKGLEVQRLYVHQNYLRLKIGKRLMDHAKYRAKSQGEIKIWLGVWEFNERAKKFYEGLGFRYFGTHPFPIGNTPQTDLWMVKDLEAS